MNAADVIAARLYDAGVRHAFGIPGGEVLTLLDALARVGIQFHLSRHENAAGFMAEGAWHATGAPGVLIATVGPGVANAFNVIANAEQDRVPLIVLSGMVDPAEAMSYTHQVFDHSRVLSQICKASFVAAPGAIAVTVDKALGIATSGRPGPVHIDLPIAVAAAEEPPAPGPLRGITAPAAPTGEALAEARRRLAEAERPILIAGLDAVFEPGAAAEVARFCEARQIPVVTTYKAKGILPEDHPLCLGGHGLSPKSDALVLPLLGEADLVLSIGYDPIEMRTGWRSPWAPERCIEIVHAPNEHDMHYAGVTWIASIAESLRALGDVPTRAVWPGGEPAATRQRLADAFAPRPDWGPGQALSELLGALPENAVATVDSGAHRILMSQMPFCRQPRSLLQSTGLCTMGCALPLALGHRIGDPTRPVLAVMGDGCLEMVLGELATLRDTGQQVVLAVLVDRSLALIELKQRRMGLQNTGVDFGRTDFVAIAKATGGEGIRVSGPGEAGPALEDAFARPGFTLIEIEIPRRSYDGLF